MVDCHTHLGRAADASPAFVSDVERAWGAYPLDVDLAQARAVLEVAERAIVLPIDGIHAGITIPNELIAEAVAQEPRLIGFASIDPTRPDAVERAEFAFGALGLRGLKLGPIYQGVHPHDERVIRVVSVAARHGLPVVWHQGTTFSREGPLEYAQPYLLDRIGRLFPDTPMWIAHLGHPWCDETMALIRKQPLFYADVSALVSRPFQLYRAVVSAVEYRVIDKLLFGSDWPFFTPSQTVDALRAVNRHVAGTALPRVPEEAIEQIIARRDVLALLGIET